MQYAVKNGILDLETIKSEVLMDERKKILRRHCYDVWQNKTNHKWYTYLPDEKKGRVQRERKTKEDIENVIVDFYKKNEIENTPDKSNTVKRRTIETVFPEWFDYKSKHDVAGSYMKKIYDHWNKYYVGDEIIKIDLTELTDIKMEMWAYQLIKKYDMSKKEYYNVTVIIRQMLQYATDMGYISKNPFTVKINKKTFRKDKKKEDSTQVFLITEQPLVEQACWDKFNKSPMYVSSLAILLAFKTGVRVGELVAIRESDIEGNYCHIQREEVGNFIYDKDGKPQKHGTKVVEHTKSNAGDRYVYLTKEARHIIECVIKANRLYGNCDEDFLFVKDNHRLQADSIIKRLYCICDYAGVPKKSSHKIRKTVISGLIDGGVNINTIRKVVGHEKESTTYNSYCFDRRPKDMIEEQFELILDSPKANQSKPIKTNQKNVALKCSES